MQYNKQTLLAGGFAFETVENWLFNDVWQERHEARAFYRLRKCALAGARESGPAAGQNLPMRIEKTLQRLHVFIIKISAGMC